VPSITVTSGFSLPGGQAIFILEVETKSTGAFHLIPDKKLSTYSIISFNKASRQVFIQNLL
jgi:hypothetical protein